MTLTFTSIPGKKYSSYTLSGFHGSIHFWLSPNKPAWLERFPGDTHQAGVEIHYRRHSRPSTMGYLAYFKACPHNKGDCWTTGSPLLGQRWLKEVWPGGEAELRKKLEEHYQLVFKEGK